MSGPDRLAVLSALIGQGVAPVFYHPDPEVCIAVATACARGGAPCVEFTNRGDFAADVFRDLSRHLAGTGDGVILGVGSIVDAPTAALYLASGARFVVGPTLNPEVARICNRRQVAYSPGCGSSTEISDAQELGCEIVKLFPGASVGGPDFVRNVLGPMPWTKIMPTGGVEADEASLRAWFGAGIVACGMGSNLIDKAMLAARDYAGIEARVRQVVGMVSAVRAAA
jgi:2-dehydro-3-deoxyphosphogluconate aldolase/(4S)-4-hydroxy-2-oxoglutarate aldolase